MILTYDQSRRMNRIVKSLRRVAKGKHMPSSYSKRIEEIVVELEREIAIDNSSWDKPGMLAHWTED